MPDSSPVSCREESLLASAHPLFERLVEAADRASDPQLSASSMASRNEPWQRP
jgi:hypothetical protein